MNNHKTEYKSPLIAYSRGQITWREAASKLDMDDFATFESALKEAGLKLYEPDAASSVLKMATLDALLDKES